MIDLKNLKEGILDQYETAEFIGVPVEEIINNINNNQLQARKIGEKYFIKTSSVKMFLKNANVGSQTNERMIKPRQKAK